MTKREARAILTAKRRVLAAMDSCLEALSEQERQHAEAYWAGHIISAISGRGYGSAPIEQAEELVQ